MSISLSTLTQLDAGRTYYLSNATGEIKRTTLWQWFKCVCGWRRAGGGAAGSCRERLHAGVTSRPLKCREGRRDITDLVASIPNKKDRDACTKELLAEFGEAIRSFYDNTAAAQQVNATVKNLQSSLFRRDFLANIAKPGWFD